MKLTEIDSNRFEVFGDSGKFYSVTRSPINCECPHFQYRLKGTGVPCKHLSFVDKMIAIRLFKKSHAVLDDIRAGLTDAFDLSKKHGEDIIRELKYSGDIFESHNRMVTILE